MAAAEFPVQPSKRTDSSGSPASQAGPTHVNGEILLTLLCSELTVTFGEVVRKGQQQGVVWLKGFLVPFCNEDKRGNCGKSVPQQIQPHH